MRPRALAVLALSLGTGCLGSWLPPGGDGGARDAGSSAIGADAGTLRDEFMQTVYPGLDGACSACHSKPGGAGPAFLAPDPYDSITAYPGVIVRDATTSILVTKGVHEGPALTAAQTAATMPWLEAEAAKLPPPMTTSGPTTMPIALTMGANSIDLGQLGADFTGASITFNANLTGAELVLSSLQLATAQNGIHVIHPLFVILSGGTKYPDPVDSFSNLDETVGPNDAQPLGPGTLILNNVGPLDQLQIAFLTIEKSGGTVGGGMDGGTVVMGGCKDVADFTKDAVPTLTSKCVGCHGGNNASATNALDMTDVTNAGAQDTACGQVLTKISTSNPSNSEIFTQVDPNGGANHPFKFSTTTAFNSYVQMATQWITQEK